MNAIKKNNPDNVYTSFEAFFQRLKGKLSPNHKLKKTGRFDMKARFPEYQEETPEEKSKNDKKVEVDVEACYKSGYDSEFLSKLKSFLTFFSKMFKPGSNKQDV